MADERLINAEAIKLLRERTSLSISDCIGLLIAANGDVELALELRHTPGPPLPPRFRCPDCEADLPGRIAPSECKQCGWLRFPGSREAWGKAGLCPSCGFSYRWDGQRCSHCGNGTTERPAKPVTLSLDPLSLRRPPT